MARRPRENQPPLFVVPEIPTVTRSYAPIAEPSPIAEPIAKTAEEDVIVTRMKDGRFLVATLRHHGTTSTHVVYTRRQLETLVIEAPFALGKGGK